MKREKQKHGGELTRPEKGEVLNPKGRPKGALGVKKTLKRLLSMEISVEEAGKVLKMPKKDAMLLIMIQRATDQDEDPAIQLKASQMILDRLAGKPKKVHEHKGDQKAPIILQTKTLSDEELKVLTDIRSKTA